MDASLATKGIMHVSKCVCFSYHQCETLEHLFLHYAWAIQFWSFCATVCKKIGSYTSIQHLMDIWTVGSYVKHKFGTTCVAIVAFGCYELWKGICRAIFEGSSTTTANIINKKVHSI